MGCDSPDSNFNNNVFDDGQWWCTSGWDYSYKGPIEELQKKFGAVNPPSFTHKSTRWKLEQLDEDRWLATPIGREEEVAAREAREAEEAKFKELLDGVDLLEYYGWMVKA